MVLMVSPDELEAMIASGGVAASISAKSLILKSFRSGPFSCHKVGNPRAPSFKSVVNFK